MASAAPAQTARADRSSERRLAQLRQAVHRTPADPRARLALADLLVRTGHPRRALAELDVLDALQPPGSRAVSTEPVRARALDALGRPEAALAELDRYLQRLPSAGHARFARGRIRERLGRLEAALVDYAAAVDSRATLERELARARLLERVGRPEEAALAYEEIVLRYGGASVARRALIELELARDRPRRALVHVDALIAAAGTAPRWRVVRARVLTRLSRHDEAHSELSRALREAERMVARRGSALALMERGRVHLARGDRSAALRDLQAALRRAPSLAEARELSRQARVGAQP